MIRAKRFRTLAAGRIRTSASARPDVVGQRLEHPLVTAGLDVHRDDRIARHRRRAGIVVARGDVDRAASRINRWRSPDAAARRAPDRLAFSVLAARRRRFRNRVGLPHDRSRIRVERGDAAAERAALVARLSALTFFADTGQRHIQPSVVERGGARGAREDVIVQLARPDLATGVGVHRVRRRRAVGEVHGVAALSVRALVGTDRDGCPDAGLRVVPPVGASRLRVEREDVAALAADEHAVADDGRLRAGGVHTGKPDRPLEFQLRRVGCRDAALRGVLETRVRGARAPAVPPAREIRCLQRRRRRRAAADDRRGSCRADGTPGEKASDRATLGLGQLRALPKHIPRRQRRENRLGCDCGQHVTRWRARAGRRCLVTRGARLLIDRRPVRRSFAQMPKLPETTRQTRTRIEMLCASLPLSIARIVCGSWSNLESDVVD